MLPDKACLADIGIGASPGFYDCRMLCDQKGYYNIPEEESSCLSDYHCGPRRAKCDERGTKNAVFEVSSPARFVTITLSRANRHLFWVPGCVSDVSKVLTAPIKAFARWLTLAGSIDRRLA